MNDRGKTANDDVFNTLFVQDLTDSNRVEQLVSLMGQGRLCSLANVHHHVRDMNHVSNTFLNRQAQLSTNLTDIHTSMVLDNWRDIHTLILRSRANPMIIPPVRLSLAPVLARLAFEERFVEDLHESNHELAAVTTRGWLRINFDDVPVTNVLVAHEKIYLEVALPENYD